MTKNYTLSIALINYVINWSQNECICSKQRNMQTFINVENSFINLLQENNISTLSSLNLC